MKESFGQKGGTVPREPASPVPRRAEPKRQATVEFKEDETPRPQVQRNYSDDEDSDYGGERKVEAVGMTPAATRRDPHKGVSPRPWGQVFISYRIKLSNVFIVIKLLRY